MSRPWQDELLLMTLAVAVPAEIGQLRGMDEEARTHLAARMSWPAPGPGREGLQERPGGGYMLGNMDSMLYGGPGCAEAVANLARALALLAYQPGGVRFGPLRWCAAHMPGRWADPAAAVCPACLHEEQPEPGQSLSLTGKQRHAG